MLSLNSEPTKQVFSQTIFIQVLLFLKSNIHPNTSLQMDLEMRIDSSCPKQCSNVWNKRSYFCPSTVLVHMSVHIIWPGNCFVAFSSLLSLYGCSSAQLLWKWSRTLRKVFTFALNHTESSWLAHCRWPTENLIRQPSVKVFALPVYAKDQNKIVLASSLFLKSLFVATLFSRVCSYYLSIILVI